MKKLFLPSTHWLKVRQRSTMMALLLTFALAAHAQNTTVSGTVRSSEGETLPGVNVLVKGTGQGTITDVDGEFRMQAPEDATLVFSFVGYLTQETELNEQSTINIALSPDIQQLGEVLVIGYGEQSRETVTTSVSKLDDAVLENVTYPNPTSALQGTLPGVRVQSTSGQPGAAPRVIIRGGTSINDPNAAAPLYVVDGVIRPDMNNIASEDIESVQVLKDAASTAIYGARGSNGVVVITTKKGKAGETRITYSYDLTYSEVGSRYDLASARDYIRLGRLAMVVPDKFPDATFRNELPSGFGTGNDLTNNTAYTTQYLTADNEYKLNQGWESMPDPLNPDQTIIFKDTDWQDVLFREPFSHNHHLGISGGSENATFYAGVGYLNSKGTAITTDYNRYSLSLNGNLKVRDNLSFFGRALLARATDNIIPNISIVFARAITLPPTTKYRFEDGTLAPGQAYSESNPEYYLTNQQNDNTEDDITLSLGGQWDIVPGLSFEPQLSVFNRSNESYSFQPAYLNGPGNLVDNRPADASTLRWTQVQADAVLSYVNSFNASHNLDAKLGYSYFGRETSGFSASGQGASTDLIPTLNASAEPTQVDGSRSDLAILGFFARVNYDYQYKYLLSLTARYDGASNLGENNKWGIFPGVAVGWNLHQEGFWEDMFPQDLLRLKLRASYGINGNIGRLSDFAAQGAYDVGSRYAGQAGINNTIIPNPDLQWERSKTFNVGADVGLFDNRISFLVDYFRRVTDNLITDFTLPPSTGFESILTNLGSLENKGFEVELSAQLLPPTSALQWDLAFNVGRAKNTILKLPENGTENNRVGGYFIWDPSLGDYAWRGGLQEGGTMGEYYAWQQVGIYATDAEAAEAPVDEQMSIEPRTKYGGDVAWNDIDNNDSIDSRDLTYVGNAYPTWTGGFTNTLSYKNFTLLARVDFTTGHTIENYARGFMNGQWKLNMNMTQEMVEKSWKEQGDATNFSRYYWNGDRGQANHIRGNPFLGNSTYYELGNFLAIREVTLSYNFPSTLLERIGISNLRLNVTGNNLHYFTKYKGLNPEEGGRDYGRYPIPRNIIFGATVSF